MKQRTHLAMPCLLVAAALLLACAGCADSASRRMVPPGTAQPDQYLFDKGMEALTKSKWLQAREFFKQVNETYVQSPLRPEAKLGIADTYFGEGGGGALVYAINEYREFILFYPLHRRADYAQYRLGFTHFRQMRAARRDQTETKQAIKEFTLFIGKYPNSSYLPEVKEKLREARDRIGQAEFGAGIYYYKTAKYYPAAIARFNGILKEDPEYTGRDSVYYFLGESLLKINRDAEALPFYEKLVKEFNKSEYLDESRKRIAELQAKAEARSQP